jgi:hypothetical protein
LNDSGGPANGGYDLVFTLFATNAGGDAIGGPLTNSAVGVSNGLFTVPLDFGNVFDGNGRWLEIAVSTNGANNFITLAPRQQITPTPYAIFANSASNLMASAQLDVTGLVIQDNANDAPNIIGGAAVNYVSSGVMSATIGGGGASQYNGGSLTNSVTGDFGTVGGGIQNTADRDATVGGGENNAATGNASTVGGSYLNSAGNESEFIGGGWQNTATGNAAVISGGAYNPVAGQYATIGGGNGNSANGNFATVPGGKANNAAGQYSFAGEQQAQALNDGSFVWADSQDSGFSSTANDQFLVRAQGGIGINTSQILEGSLMVNTNLYMNAHPIYLRGGDEDVVDHHHGGGFLGISDDISNAVLQWSATGVSVNCTLTVNGNVLPAAIIINGAGEVNLSGSFSGNGGGLINLNAANLTGTINPALIPNLDASKIHGWLIRKGKLGEARGLIILGWTAV